MAVKISPGEIQNLQQIEAVVAGPEDANRLFIIDGQFDSGSSELPLPGKVSRKEIFTVLVGPVFTRKQFFQANGTASLTKTRLNTGALPSLMKWGILNVDADWDDESGQVELRIETEVEVIGSQNDLVAIVGFAFHVTILAAVTSK
jgi:hypothetical protein